MIPNAESTTAGRFEILTCRKCGKEVEEIHSKAMDTMDLCKKCIKQSNS